MKISPVIIVIIVLISSWNFPAILPEVFMAIPPRNPLEISTKIHPDFPSGIPPPPETHDSSFQGFARESLKRLSSRLQGFLQKFKNFFRALLKKSSRATIPLLS